MRLTEIPSSVLPGTSAQLRSITSWGAAECSRIDVIELPAGGTLPRHPAGAAQTMVVLSGQGQVTGEDDVRSTVTQGHAVSWEPGEQHTTWAVTDLAVLIVQTRPVPPPPRGHLHGR